MIAYTSVYHSYKTDLMFQLVGIQCDQMIIGNDEGKRGILDSPAALDS